MNFIRHFTPQFQNIVLRSSSDLFSLEDFNFYDRKCVVCKSDIRFIVLRPCGCICLCDHCRIALAARKYKDLNKSFMYFHWRLHSLQNLRMSEIEPLFVQYLDEPIEVDPVGCKTVSAFIKKAQKKFSPQLDEFPLAKLTLHRYTGTKLRPGLKIRELLKQSGFENSDLTPLLIRYVDDVLPVIKKTHKSEDRKRRWDELNPILIEVAAKKRKGSSAYSSLTWKLISPIYKLAILRSIIHKTLSAPMESTDSNFISAPILKTATDWLQFSHIFEANCYLKDSALWNVVVEGNPVLSEADVAGDDEDKKREKFKLREIRKVNDKKALAILTKMVVSTPKISLVIGKKTCKEAFDALGAIFNRSSQALITHLSDEYRDHILGRQSITDYVSALGNIRQQLINAKAEGFSDDSHVLKLLRGLQSSPGVRDSRFEMFYYMKMEMINESANNPLYPKPSIETIVAGLLDIEILKEKSNKSQTMHDTIMH